MHAPAILALVVAAVVQFHGANGHGMLMDPVNRGSAWRKGFDTPVNYDDDGNYCGGLSVMIQNGGKCGLCGDDYRLPQPRPNENTGTFGVGRIVKTYKQGQLIELTATLTANHKGTFRYAVCPLNSESELETEECFEKYPLTMENGDPIYTLASYMPGDFTMKAYLPQGLTCKHCVLRWEYRAANNWGKCSDGTYKTGCGPQETFKTCSDIQIVA